MPLSQSAADELLLVNGDQISGRVLKKENKTLSFLTDYAGTITVNWLDISRLSTDREVTVLTTDNELLKGTLELDWHARTLIKPTTGGPPRSVAISEIDYINPPPFLAGEGADMSGVAALGLSVERGNTNLDSINFDTEWILRLRRTRYTAAATARRAENDGVVEKSNSSITLKYDNFIDQKRYAYSIVDRSEDQIKNIDNLWLWGVGVGYQFVESAKRQLYIETGLSYIDEESITDQDREYLALRWSLKFEHLLFNSSTQFFHHHEALFSIDKEDEKIVEATTGLRFPLTGNLHISIEYAIDWNNNPLSDTQKLNSVTLVNIGYNW